MKSIYVAVLNDMLCSSLSVTLDIFQTAQSIAHYKNQTYLDKNTQSTPMRIPFPQVQVRVVGLRQSMQTQSGMTRIKIQCDTNFKQTEALRLQGEYPDWIVMPGSAKIQEQHIIEHMQTHEVKQWMKWIKLYQNTSSKISATCSSVFLLAQAGLLEDKTVTTTWWLAHTFRKLFPHIALNEERIGIRDGNIFTGGSAFAQIDAAMAVVKDVWGTEISELCIKYLLINEKLSQAPYMVMQQTRHYDHWVIAIEKWVDANLEKTITVKEMAQAFHLQSKTLTRRLVAATGQTPIKFVQKRRVMLALHLIETTSMNIENIAAKTGYQDATALRKLLKREVKANPSSLRKNV